MTAPSAANRPLGNRPIPTSTTPAIPCPTMGGGLCCNPIFSQGGAYDQRCVEAREDVLVYTTPPLEQPMEVTGPVKLILYAGSSATDTDWTAKLVDVAPCGYARNLTDGILRARYRARCGRGHRSRRARWWRTRWTCGRRATRFLAGHRIRLEVSSSNFPRFDRNPNTGEQPGRSGRDGERVADGLSLVGVSDPPRFARHSGDLSMTPDGTDISTRWHHAASVSPIRIPASPNLPTVRPVSHVGRL